MPVRGSRVHMTPATSAGIMVWMMTAIGIGGMAMRVRFCPAKLAAAPSSPMAEDRAAS